MVIFPDEVVIRVKLELEGRKTSKLTDSVTTAQIKSFKQTRLMTGLSFCQPSKSSERT